MAASLSGSAPREDPHEKIARLANFAKQANFGGRDLYHYQNFAENAASVLSVLSDTRIPFSLEQPIILIRDYLKEHGDKWGLEDRDSLDALYENFKATPFISDGQQEIVKLLHRILSDIRTSASP